MGDKNPGRNDIENGKEGGFYAEEENKFFFFSKWSGLKCPFYNQQNNSNNNNK